MQEFSVKKWMDSGEYADKKAIINREINSTVVNTNSKEYRERYKKSPEEKAQLFNMREEWKKYTKERN